MTLTVKPTAFSDVKLLVPKIFNDGRGSFFESFNEREFNAAISDDPGNSGNSGNFRFVQDNHSLSFKHVVRGLHYQIQHPQGKLVRVIAGEIFDVVVDIRRQSPNFGRWIGTILSAKNKYQLWVPPGFAHGFATLSDTAECLYKTTDYRYPAYECCIRWNDPELAIDWPIERAPVLSEQGASAPLFKDAPTYPCCVPATPSVAQNQ